MHTFQDRVAVITGAASGIGRGLARRCVHEGMKVVLADIEAAALAETETELRAVGAPVLAAEATIFGYSQLLQGWTMKDRLREIQVPTLVMGGREDFLFPPEHQAILADRIPNAQLEIIERAGHNPQMERPALD